MEAAVSAAAAAAAAAAVAAVAAAAAAAAAVAAAHGNSTNHLPRLSLYLYTPFLYPSADKTWLNDLAGHIPNSYP